MKIVLLLLTLSVFARAQTSSSPPSREYNVGVDCSTLENAVGCKSYNEMFIAKDKDLLESFDDDEAYVCFPESFDEFFVIAFSEPLPRDFRPTVKGEKGPPCSPDTSYSRVTDAVSQMT